ncbi:YdaU family protein [Pseudomonas leptonychotis]|uniref:YdaU family protein n=1 Tax=Pseudomonas leptonychotis TaxID=2448482 RepID=UPI003864D96E
MNYYQFHISDWALHTSHLTLEEEAVYRRLLDFYYDTESAIPEETNQVIRRLRLGNNAALVASILSEFFDLRGGFWHNNRADKEISLYHAKAETARANGKSGGRPKKTVANNPEETKPVISDNPEITGSKANQEPVTSNQDKSKAHVIAAANDEQTDESAEPQAKADRVPYETIFETYAATLPELPQPKIRDEARRKAIRSLWRSDARFQSVDFWGRYYGAVRTSKFLMGMNGIGFDWLMKPANFKKVVEGNYQ